MALYRWAEIHGPVHAKEFIRLRTEDFDAVRDLDFRRRRMKTYFLRIARYKRAGLMSDNEILGFIHKAQANPFLNIVVPMEDALNDKWRGRAQGIGTYAVRYCAQSFPLAAPDEIKGGAL